MDQIQFGVVGAGYWGPHIIRNISELPGASLSVISDLSEERLAPLRRRYPEALLTQDYADLLSSDVDAVVIATPVKTHFTLAAEALKAGKHVLVEKPITRTSNEALALIELAQASGLVLMVGHTFEFNPAVVRLRQIVASGEIGNVLYIDSARLNLGQFRRDVNVLWDLAPHDISIANYILGAAPTLVSARGNTCITIGNHDVAYMELRYPCEVLGHCHVSWLEPCKVRRFTVVGDEKMVVYNDVHLEEKLRVYDKGVIKSTSSGDFNEFQLNYHYGGITIPAVEWAEPLKIQLDHFVECIVDGATPRTDGWSGYRVVTVLEAADRSIRNAGACEHIDCLNAGFTLESERVSPSFARVGA